MEHGRNWLDNCPRTTKNNRLKRSKTGQQISFAGHGDLIMIVMWISATSAKVLPFFIFPWKKFHIFKVEDYIKGDDGTVSDNSWQTEATFLKYLQHSVANANPSLKNPILLFLDNHPSHEAYSKFEICERKRDCAVIIFASYIPSNATLQHWTILTILKLL